MTVSGFMLRQKLNTRLRRQAARQVFGRGWRHYRPISTPLSLALRCSGVGGEARLFNALLNYRYSQSNETDVEIEDVQWLDEQARTHYPVTGNPVG